MLSLSGVTSVIWFEGINDFGKQNDASVEEVQAGLKEGVARMRARLPGRPRAGRDRDHRAGRERRNHGHAEEDASRKALNAFIRSSGLFDAVLDFDRAVLDPATGQLRPELAHNTTVGGKGDGIHPNRLGYLAMALSVDLALFQPAPARPPPRRAPPAGPGETAAPGRGGGGGVGASRRLPQSSSVF